MTGRDQTSPSAVLGGCLVLAVVVVLAAAAAALAVRVFLAVLG